MFGEWGSLQKHKKTRLTGKSLAALNKKIYDRDGGCCIICGAYIQPGEKFHHVWQAADKEDVEEKGVMLCGKCHHEAHFGEKVKEIREKCKEYLRGLYGERI